MASSALTAFHRILVRGGSISGDIMPIDVDTAIAKPVAATPFRLFSDREFLTLSVPEQIALQVADRILAEQLAPGEHIVEQELAESFKVSRGPIREAIRILEREGLVTVQPRRGALVRQLSPQDLRDLAELQEGLLALALGRLRQAAPTWLAEALRQALPDLLQAHEGGDADVFLSIADSLIERLSRQAGNRRLYHMLYSVALQTLCYRRQTFGVIAARQRCLQRWSQELAAL